MTKYDSLRAELTEMAEHSRWAARNARKLLEDSAARLEASEKLMQDSAERLAQLKPTIAGTPHRD